MEVTLGPGPEQGAEATRPQQITGRNPYKCPNTREVNIVAAQVHHLHVLLIHRHMTPRTQMARIRSRTGMTLHHARVTPKMKSMLRKPRLSNRVPSTSSSHIRSLAATQEECLSHAFTDVPDELDYGLLKVETVFILDRAHYHMDLKKKTMLRVS